MLNIYQWIFLVYVFALPASITIIQAGNEELRWRKYQQEGRSILPDDWREKDWIKEK